MSANPVISAPSVFDDVRLAPRNDFASTFAFYKLPAVLKSHGAFNYGMLRWYWAQARYWDSATTQEAFDAMAERRVRARCDRPDQHLTLEDRTEFQIAMRAGIKKRIPDEKWWLKENAEQEAWLALFERKAFNGRDANVLGQTAARRQTRAQREIPISQIETLRDEDGETMMPWDNKPACRAAGFDESFHRVISDQQDDIRREILRQLQHERRDDYDFLLGYVLSRRRETHTGAERRRARTIIDRLRRLEATECFPDADERHAQRKKRASPTWENISYHVPRPRLVRG